MAKLSHSGIEKLKNKYEFFKKIPFPDIPEDDALYDLYADLVDLDSYLIGIIVSLLKEKEIEKESISFDNNINQRLNEIKVGNDKGEISKNSLIEYKKNLEELIVFALKLLI